MRMYPAYKLRDVMEEYAITFFALLEEGYRQENRRLSLLAQISMLPNAKPQAQKDFVKQFDNAAKDITDDILRPSTSASSEESEAKLKRLLG